MIIFISFAEFVWQLLFKPSDYLGLSYSAGQLTKIIVSLIFMYLLYNQIISSQYRNYGKLILFFNI